MRISVSLERERKKVMIELPAKATVRDLLIQLKINPVAVLVTRGDDVLIDDALLKDKDAVEVRSVVSGG